MYLEHWFLDPSHMQSNLVIFFHIHLLMNIFKLHIFL